MSFKVLYRGYQHIRLSSSFSLTLDIQDYLRSLARDEKGIESIQFYMDQQHFTLRIKEGFSVLDNAEAFLKKIDKGKVSELMTLPVRREESAYSIVSGAAIKRVLFRSLVPSPIRYIWTCYQAFGYVKEAYQTLARKELTMEVLDCSAILLSFVYEPIQDCQQHHVYACFGESFRPVVLEKNCNRFRTEPSCKRE